MLPGNNGDRHVRRRLDFSPVLMGAVGVVNNMLDQTFNVGAAYLGNLGQHIPPFSTFMGINNPWNTPSTPMGNAPPLNILTPQSGGGQAGQTGAVHYLQAPWRSSYRRYILI